MQDNYNIAFIGAGNLAWHLAPALENAGHKISFVCNRSRKNAHQLIDRLYHAEYKRNLNFSKDQLDLLIIAINDSYINQIVTNIILPEDCLLVHTSGSLPLEILEKSAAYQLGVLYPLQSFTKKVKIDFREVPIYLESNSESGLNKLINISKGLSKNVYQLSSSKRLALHLAAVYSTNFSNHLFSIAKRILTNHGIDYNHLKPLSHTMIHKIFTIGPEKGQTGPAIRHDLATMDSHMEMLSEDEELMEIYSILSKHIMKSAKKNKKR